MKVFPTQVHTSQIVGRRAYIISALVVAGLALVLTFVAALLSLHGLSFLLSLVWAVSITGALVLTRRFWRFTYKFGGQAIPKTPERRRAADFGTLVAVIILLIILLYALTLR